MEMQRFGVGEIPRVNVTNRCHWFATIGSSIVKFVESHALSARHLPRFLGRDDIELKHEMRATFFCEKLTTAVCLHALFCGVC